MPDSLVPVAVGACRCIGTPHPDGDFVYLRPKLRFVHTSAIKYELVLARQAAGGNLSVSDTLAILSQGYVLHGVDSWNLTDAQGKPRPVTQAEVEEQILEDPDRSLMVAEEADNLYSEQVILPLVRLAGISSLPMPTSASTSATNGSTRPRKPSKPSLTTTTAREPASE